MNKEAKRRSREIDNYLDQELRTEQQIVRLLILGPSHSGKSSLFKQMRSAFGKGFRDDDRRQYIPIISNNIIRLMKILCEQSEKLSQKGYQNTEITSNNSIAKSFIAELKGTEIIDSKISNYIASLWNDSGIKQTYEYRSIYHLTEFTTYFLDKISEIGNEMYLPTDSDIIHSYIRTTGIHEIDFQYNAEHYRLIDIGQHNDNKKWIYLFQDVRAIIFVISLEEYDMLLDDDESLTRLHKSIELFEYIVNLSYFKSPFTYFILFLNKRDLFAQKLFSIPFKKYFTDYEGKNTYEEITQYIIEQFQNRNKNTEKYIYTHITSVVDYKSVTVAFPDAVMRQSLYEAGLLS